MKTKTVPLVVTTVHKGVFFGWGTPGEASEIRLEKAQMCIYWDCSIKGVLGLASTGPDKNCKVTLAIPAITLRDVTSVMEASPEAAKAWEKQPWK